MPNTFEAIFNMLRISFDNTNESKSPLHMIEVRDLWKYVTLVEEFIRYEEMSLVEL
ncbi:MULTISPECIES: hypothetical protein [Bacillaceae]|uniref:hypothetical protein n=1 Tax=Bacillaceae TaxID=186817 RepID=UPI0015C85C7E|nr:MULTISPECIES: hypothetical protein [Bacillaceae]URM34843.1 hypothetical protein LLY41_10895 [Cytobacillus firmus]